MGAGVCDVCSQRRALCNNLYMDFAIIDLSTLPAAARQQVAQILVDAFAKDWPSAWPSLAEAEAELADFNEVTLCRVAVRGEQVLGWVGAIPEYDGNVWELHPLAIAPAHQRQGIGRALVADIETQVRARGGLVMMLGSDDESYITSLGGQDLFPDPLSKLAAIEDRGGHPFVFYRKLGYSLIGVVPDANGPGKPDILMAKRLAP